MTYSQSLDYLYSQLPMYQRQGPKAFKKNLNNIKALADWLNNPQHDWPCIHVAGTNGKGTTSHMIAATLQAAGYKVGLYTSPHYKDFRERVKINGQLMAKRAVSQFVSKFQREASEIKASFFEITVAMAFQYFKDQSVDIAVIETGLGGRLDSTNIVDPMLSVITNISLDHTNFLGNTLELIAAEKAGIIKNGKAVVIGRKQKETDPVFRSIAKKNNAELVESASIVSSKVTDANELLIKYKNGKNDLLLTNSDMPFYQENVRTALTTIEVLVGISQFNISAKHIKTAFRELNTLTYFIGRWMILSRAPLIIGDSAHNVDGLTKVMDKLIKLKGNHLHIVLGFVNDKDLSKVLALFPKHANYYFAKANIPRGLAASSLRSQAREFGLVGKSYISMRKAFTAAKATASNDDLIYVGGSIFTLAEVI